MSYNKWYITGDTHGNFTRFHEIKDKKNIAVIILGDTAVNWNLNQEDQYFKNHLKNAYPNITWYLLRGNHDARPTIVPSMLEDWDDEVEGYVYYEPEFLHIRYFKDGGEYKINSHTILTIGGAYSVDKYYRIDKGYKWFEDEQLSSEEMDYIADFIKNKKYDIVLTHTCPHSWEPTDLFLPIIDQSTVDKTMELWLDKIKDTFKWKIWLFGHYHADRAERPHVEQLYQIIEELDTIWKRWNDPENKSAHWVRKSPMFYLYK